MNNEKNNFSQKTFFLLDEEHEGFVNQKSVFLALLSQLWLLTCGFCG